MEEQQEHLLKNLQEPRPCRRRGWTWQYALFVLLVVAISVSIFSGLHFGKQSSDSSEDSSSFDRRDLEVKRSIWQPAVGTTWQIDLPDTLTDSDVTKTYQVWDFDLFDNSASVISSFHSQGVKVICYFSAGTYENWRPDAKDFLPSDLGKDVSGWPGERWVNTSSTNVRNIMLARLDMAVSKGCDGVDPDNVDAYDNGGGGFHLTEATAINYVTFLAGAAKSRGLSIGLKNAGDIIPNVINLMQWSVNEQCIEYDECSTFRPFITAGKPVFHIEYPKGQNTDNKKNVTAAQKKKYCDSPSESSFSTVLKNYNLDFWVETC